MPNNKTIHHIAGRLAIALWLIAALPASAAVVFEEDWSSGRIDPRLWQTTNGTTTDLVVEDISGNGTDHALRMWIGPNDEFWVSRVRSVLHFRRGNGLRVTATLWGDPTRGAADKTYPEGGGWMFGFFKSHYINQHQSYEDPEAVLDDWYFPPTNPTLRLTESPTLSAFLGEGGPRLSSAYMSAMQAATTKATAVQVRISLGDTRGARFEWYDRTAGQWVTEVDTIGSGTSNQERVTLGFASPGGSVFIDDIVVEGTAELYEDWSNGLDANRWNSRNSASGLLQVESVAGGSDEALLMWVNGGTWSIGMKAALGFRRTGGLEMEATIWGDPTRTDGTNTYPEGLGWLLGLHRDGGVGGFIFDNNEAVFDHWYTTGFPPVGAPLRLQQGPTLSSFQGGGVAPASSAAFMNALLAATSKADAVRVRIQLDETVGASFAWFDPQQGDWAVMLDTRGVSGGDDPTVFPGFGPASAAVYVDDISVRGAADPGILTLPDDFPRFEFGGNTRVSRLLSNYYHHHFSNRVISGAGNKVLFNKEYIALSDMWAGNLDDTFNVNKTSQEIMRQTLLDIGIEADGYVHTHQHFSHAHEFGWPFPYWTQAYAAGGDAVGWHFQTEGIGALDFLRAWGDPNLYSSRAINGWSLANVTNLDVQELPAPVGYGGESRWELSATGAGAMLTPPGQIEAGLDFSGAQWIWYPEGSPEVAAPVATRYLRHEFTLAVGKTVDSAEFLLTGDNQFDLYVNEAQAGLGRGFNNRAQIDISAHLQAGANALGLAVANGGADPNPAGAIGRLRIRYSDGTTQEVTTGANWKASTTAPAGWASSGFNDAAWPAALELGAYGVLPWATNVAAPDFTIDTFLAPFLQVRYKIQPAPPASMQPYVEWKREGDANWSADRRVYFEYGNGNEEYEAATGVQHSMITMHTHPLWNGKIKRLRFNLAPGVSSGEISVDSVFTVLDTRHSTNNTNFLLACWEYFRWTGDTAWLAQNMNRMRLALKYLREDLGGVANNHIVVPWVGHDGRTGVDVNKSPRSIPGRGIGGNYWDLLPFGGRTMFTSSQYHKVTRIMAELERAIVQNPGWNVPDGPNRIDPAALETHAQQVREDVQQTFWNSTTQRFGGGVNIIGTPTLKDYGLSFVNLESIWYGVASEAQADSIYAWLDGDRIVSGDTSQGADIYTWRLGPRATTRRNVDWYNFPWSQPDGIPFGGQIQDGGAVLGFTFFDLWGRLTTKGPDDAWQRFMEIMDWEEDVWEAGGYRPYYQVNPGTLQGGGTAGGIGIDFEFLESTMPPAIVPLGFMGLDPDTERLNIAPRMPTALSQVAVHNMQYRGVVLDMTVGADFREVTLHDTPTEPLRVRFATAWTLEGTLLTGQDFELDAAGTYRFIEPETGARNRAWQILD